MSEDKIKYFDMFAGIGGFRTGLANAGDIFLPVGWCEIDRFAQKAYRTLYDTGGEYYCSDATKIDTDELPEIDLICGGFPCQPFSVSGRRLGFNDTRGTLFHEIVRVAQARHPKYLLLENVPGLLKGDIMRNYGSIAEKYYGYKISVIDLRNPMRSHGNNLLHLVNKYMDLYGHHLVSQSLRTSQAGTQPFYATRQNSRKV